MRNQAKDAPCPPLKWVGGKSRILPGWDKSTKNPLRSCALTLDECALAAEHCVTAAEE
jgi:hypothetical protein